MAYSKEQLRYIFQNKFDRDAWKAIIKGIFQARVRIIPEKFSIPNDTEEGYYFGFGETPDRFRIGYFYYKIKNGSVAHKKVGLRNLVKSFLNQTSGNFDAALVVFDDGKEWRLSFVCDIKEEATAPKRFTYVFGEHDNFYRTPIERFTTLQDEEPSFKNIRKAFSVEALSDDFFDQYRDYYADFVEFITGKRYVKEGAKWVERIIHKPNYQYSDTFGSDDKLVRNYIKKMFGRIVFLYFLQRKGWLDGNRNYMHDLFANSDKKDDFLDGVLEPLFFEILNTDKPYRTDAAKALPGSDNIPYLNGGLFAADEIDELDCKFPESLFSKFFNFLDSYNFTIDENDTDDAEIGIDPEMLGRIFENLLEDNKDKGAFYTPKEIVDYMCRESIIAYLQNDRFTDSGNETIRKFVETYDGTSLSVEQRKYLKDKLKSVKICDPAIGSGAFPMGLVNLLSKLYSALRLSTDAAVIKRHIMEQNIYGVDIERGAVDIARLRFWLAMIVEEKDPIPLPNLHFKIMQGNSLLESYQGVDLSDMTKVKPKTRNLFDSEDIERETLVADLKKYYETSDHAERDRLFNDIIKNVRRQLFAKGITLPAGVDPSENSEFFLWHTWFSDVFEKGGFDIVIGNPPYIQLQGNGGTLANLYEGCEFESFARTGDIYCLFYEQGWRMLKSGGNLCYITSNKWMRAGYGKDLREFLAKKTNPKLLLDLGGIQVFDSATVDTNILLFSKEDNRHEIQAVSGSKRHKDILKNLSDFVRHNVVTTDFATSDSWVILSPIELSIKRKIEAIGVPLKDWDINIYRGVLTGYNEAFIITTEKRNEILSKCQTPEERQRTEELIRPILRGRDIKRYGYEWAGLYLIATFPSRNYDIEKYPAVKRYLLSFAEETLREAGYGWVADTYLADFCKQKLSQTGEFVVIDGKRIRIGSSDEKARKKTSNKWFETQDSISYWDDFSKPKIVYPNMTKYLPFVYDDNAFFTNQKCFFITTATPAYLTAFFNSSLFKFCFRENFPELQGGTRELSKIFFDKIPVLIVDRSVENQFRELVLSIQQTHDDIIAKEIDEKIFDLYGLNQDERNHIGFIEIQ